jgi:hypothetical protein
MAYNTAEGRASYTASSGQTEFDFVFKIFSQSDIKVYKTPSGDTPDDTQDILALSTNYTVIIDGDNGGTVTLLSGATAGDTIVIVRDLAVKRDTDYQDNGDLTASTLDNDQNYQTYLAGQANEIQERALRIPDSSVGVDTKIPSAISGALLRYNLAGDGFDLLNANDVFNSSNAISVNTIIDMEALDDTIFKVCIVKDLDRGGTFIWSSTGTANGGTVFAGTAGYWTRQYSGAVNVKWFGAADGEDSTTAINNAIYTIISSGEPLYIPNGSYNFSSPITIPAINNFVIFGDGRQKSFLNYVGTSTTVDLVTIGDGTTSFTGLSLFGFNITSSTLMTSGNAIRIRKQQNGGTELRNISLGALNGARNLYDGIWFDNTNVTDYVGFELTVQNTAIKVSGNSVNDSGSDAYIDKGTITFAKTGLVCGGGFGGLYIGKVLFFGNETHMKIDNSIASRFNREIILSDLAVFDGCEDYAIYVNDPLASGSNLTINSFIGSAGRIGTGGAGNNIHIAAYPNCRVTINSGQIFNAMQNGVWIGDATTLVSISDNVQITNNGAYGIYGDVETNFVNYQCTFQANTVGDISPNIRPIFQYTAVVLASTGTLGSASGTVNYHRVGNRVWFDIYANISSNGTGSGTITCSLPWQTRQAACATGHTNGVAYQAVFAQIPANSNYLQITFYNGTYPGATGQTIVISGSCEVY